MTPTALTRLLPATAAVVFSAGATLADPAPLPQTDFTAKWEMTGVPEQMGPSRISYSQALNKMRVDMNMQGQEMTMVRDMESGMALMWTTMMAGMAMRIDTGKEIKLEGEPTGRTDSVSGEDCEIWLSNDSEVCITDDGIPVRTVGHGVTATMVEIDRTAQDPSQFEAPEGAQVMDMPKGMPNMGGTGMPPGMKLPF